MSSDRLSEIFAIQKQFIEKYFVEQQGAHYANLSKEDKVKWSKEYLLCCVNELMETLNEIKWKKHRFIHKDDNIDNFVEELVDTFKFMLNLLLIHGCDEEKFFEKFVDKSKVVEIRYEQEKKLKELRNKKDVKLAVIDIDGIICAHSQSFLELCKVDYKTIYDFKNNDIALYNKCKHDFRINGHKKHAQLIINISGFLQTLKDKGYLVLLLTARPYEKIIRLYADTLYWLESNGLKYDFLFFNKAKEQFIIDNLSAEQVSFCIDDEIDNVNKLCLYFKTYLIPNYYLYDRRELNKVNHKVTIIDSINDIKL